MAVPKKKVSKFKRNIRRSQDKTKIYNIIINKRNKINKEKYIKNHLTKDGYIKNKLFFHIKFIFVINKII